MLTRSLRRRWMMGVPTVLGFRPKGFFLPHRYAATVKPSAYPGLEPTLKSAEPSFKAFLANIEAYSDDLLALPGKSAGARFDQDWFPGLDALSAYTIVRDLRPRRIVEIGSGHSTRFLASGLEDGGLRADLLCIDPAPRATLDHLNVRWRSSVLQDAPLDDVIALEANDVLFVDSSHLLMPGTDVDYLIGHVLPCLRPGVHVHIHDIFLPDPYPESWAWRGYNEQSAVAALLQGEGYGLVFASHYVATRMAGRLRVRPFEELGVIDAKFQSSVWLRKR